MKLSDDSAIIIFVVLSGTCFGLLVWFYEIKAVYSAIAVMIGLLTSLAFMVALMSIKEKKKSDSNEQEKTKQ